MKHIKELAIDPTQEVALTYIPDFQDTPFTIHGDYEDLAPLAEAMQAEDAAHTSKARTDRVTRATKSIGHNVLETITKPAQGLSERLRADVTAGMFDLFHNDTSLAELRNARRQEARLAIRMKLGLITTDRCAKHERLLKQVS